MRNNFIVDAWESFKASRIGQIVVGEGLPTVKRQQMASTANSLFFHLHPSKVHRRSASFMYTMGLGGTSFLLFLILTVTGVLLMFYYRPSIPTAYHDMQDLSFVVPFGKILRNLHRWSAHAILIVTALHMWKVLARGAFKKPRELNWVFGVILFILMMALSFTGYLLPWDQLAMWAITVGTNMMRSAPLVGEPMSFLVLGGNLVGENALIRFYVMHCIVLPLIAALFIALHFWRIRKDGFSIPGRVEEETS
ncbi:cytochrome b N-terminal domain-containing protein [bacterium]|nr:cytochrome b N-terminal domain-containing protein [bacterium]